MFEEQSSYRDKCRQAGLHGIYMPTLDRFDGLQPIWQLPDGSLVTVATPASNPICEFRTLYAALSLPRVPIGFPFDPAYLLTVF